MGNKTISQTDIDRLATKLDEFSQVLTNDEQALLLGLLGVAESALSQASSQVEAGSISAEAAATTLVAPAKLPRLSEGLKSAFTVGGLVRGIGGLGGGEVQDSIGVGGTCVTWTKDLKVFKTPGDLVSSLPGMKIRQ